MGSRMVRDRSREGSWWLMVGLFTICVVGWSLAFSLKVGASAVDSSEISSSQADQIWSLKTFTKIRILGGYKVSLRQGDVEKVSANGNAQALAQLEVFVEDGELIVRNKAKGWLKGWAGDSQSNIDLVIEFQSLEKLTVGGSAELRSRALYSDELILDVAGSGDISVTDLRGTTLELRVAGSADVELTGDVTEQAVKIAGSADYHAEQLSSKNVSIVISGSGGARLRVSDDLDARVSGSGSVRYRGNPEVNSSIHGSGRIQPL